jgi:nucleotide-binding universal stress UspA family protein
MIDPCYRSVAVASAFSPRFVQVMSEAKRISERFGAALSMIYVGEKTAETVARFDQVLGQLRLPLDSVIHYQKGDPASAILQVAQANNIELIVAGALEKEAILHPFLGNVARRLVREASCSIMLFTKPEQAPKPLRQIVFMAEYGDHARTALGRTLWLAAREKSEKLFVIRVYTSFDQARAKVRTSAPEAGEPAERTLEEEEAALEEFIDTAGPTEIPIEARCIRGNTGYAALDFIQSVDASLLAVPLDPASTTGELPAHVSWVTDVIPCNLWVIR